MRARGLSFGPIVRVVLSIALLGAVASMADAKTVAALRGAAPFWLAALLLLYSADRLLMAFKWWLLLRAKRLPVSLSAAIRGYYVSSFVGMFLPMTVGGDIVRIGAMQGAGAPTTALLSSIAIERLIGALAQGLLCLLSVGLIAATQMQVEVEPLRWGLGLAGLLALLMLALPLSFGLAKRIAKASADRGGFMGKLGALCTDYAAWRLVPGAMRTFMLLTLLESLFPIALYAAASRAVGADLGLLQLTAIVPLIYLIARLPLATFGVEQLGFVAAAAQLGGDRTSAVAVTLVVLFTLVVALVPGAIAYVLGRRNSGGAAANASANPEATSTLNSR